MPGIERIWRITADSGERVDVRLSYGSRGESQVIIESNGGQPSGGFDVGVARAVAQATLEAVEVASALSEQTVVIR